MRHLLVALCCVGFSFSLGAIEIPEDSPPHKVAVLSGAVLRDDIDLERGFHFQHGIEYSYRYDPRLFFATAAEFSLDRQFQARNSYLEENLYALHVLAYYSYSYLLRFSLGAGPSLRAAQSTQGIKNEIIYKFWQVGIGAVASFKIDYAITPRWEVGYDLSLEARLPEPRTVWRRDISHLLGAGYRF